MAQPLKQDVWPAAAETGDEHMATQLLQHESDYLDDRPDIGRAVGDGVRELFISTDPAIALQQQFEFRKTSFIALHDLNCTTSRKLLVGVAASFGRPVHRLEIRRHGYGTTYATIEFVDCPTTRGTGVRLYSTDIDADTQTRQALTRVLMAHSTITVAMLGDVPLHVVNEQLDRLRQQMQEDGWHCRQLEFMPLFATSGLETAVGNLGVATRAQVHVTPPVTRPLDAWTYLSAAWNQLQQTTPSSDGKPALLGPLSVNPGTATATATMRAAAIAPVPAQASELERLIQGIADLPGVTSCCIFELTSSRTLAQVGMEPAPVEMARRGTTLIAMARSTRKQLGAPGQADEVIVMGGTPALAVRVLASRPELAVHVAFTPAKADWPQLRPRIAALDAAMQPRESI